MQDRHVTKCLAAFLTRLIQDPHGDLHSPVHFLTGLSTIHQSTMNIQTADINAPDLPGLSLFHYLFPESRDNSTTTSAIPPDSIALIDGLTGRQITRKEFRLRCQSVAAALRGRGLKRGDVVGVMGLNSIEWLVAFHASHCAGLRVSPINWA
jgi:non-ribosomal peptide synthetase component F